MKYKLRIFIPPVVYLALKKIKNFRGTTKSDIVNPIESPDSLKWCTIQNGALSGRTLFMNENAEAYQKSMLAGIFDLFLFEYIDQFNWNGKVIFDVGAHIGFHTLNFAKRVGPSGKVYSFEPHPAHLDRLNINLTKNADLSSSVKVFPVALANGKDYVTFYCTQSVEGGGSSASFIKGASTLNPAKVYKNYNEITINAESLDNLVQSSRCKPPNLIKIDVEGSESLVIKGALVTIRKFKPVLIIEVHSQENMLKLTTMLHPLGYTFKVLNIFDDGRCFIAGEP